MATLLKQRATLGATPLNEQEAEHKVEAGFAPTAGATLTTDKGDVPPRDGGIIHADGPVGYAAPAPVDAKPFASDQLYQGRGATQSTVYGTEAVAQGRAVPVLGPADYYAFSKNEAKRYGTVKKGQARLDRAKVITSNREWLDLVDEAKVPQLSSVSEEAYREPEKIPEATKRLQEYLRGRGYDGLVVRIAGDQKRLRETFGDDQVIVFPKTDAPAATIDQAAHQAATSPQNDLPQPSEPQREAGNYQKGHVRYGGLDISIENPRGSKRSGVDPAGQPWEVEMSAHYGYVRRTEGADGEQVDVYLASEREDTPAFVVDQVDPKTGRFDEHKVVLGAASRREAEQIYDAQFSDGSGATRRQAVSELPMEGFKAWLKEGDTKKPIAGQKLALANPALRTAPPTPTDIPTVPAGVSPGASQEAGFSPEAHWNGLAPEERLALGQRAGWAKPFARGFAKQPWAKLSPAARNVIARNVTTDASATPAIGSPSPPPSPTRGEGEEDGSQAAPPSQQSDQANLPAAPAAAQNFKTGKQLDAWVADNVDDPDQLTDETPGPAGRLKDQGVGLLEVKPGRAAYESGREASGRVDANMARGADVRLVYRLKDGRMVWWDHESGDVHETSESDPRYKPNPHYQPAAAIPPPQDVRRNLRVAAKSQGLTPTQPPPSQGGGEGQKPLDLGASKPGAKTDTPTETPAPAGVSASGEGKARPNKILSTTYQGRTITVASPKRKGDQATAPAVTRDSKAAKRDSKAATRNSKPPAAAPHAKAETREKPAKPIEDVGEKIGGARKDLWRERGLRLADLEGMSGGEEAQYVTKENVWPAIDYPKLIADGATPQAAALIKIIRDRLAKSPKKDTPEGRRHYVEMIGIAREELEKAKTAEEIKAVGNAVFTRIGWYSKEGGGGWRNDAVREKAFSVYQGRSNPFSVEWKDTRKADKMIAEGWPATKKAKTKTQAAREEGKLPERPHLDQIRTHR